MKCKYDRQADALYIKFTDSKVAETHKVAAGVLLDTDKEGNPVGLEILNASKRLGQSPPPLRLNCRGRCRCRIQ